MRSACCILPLLIAIHAATLVAQDGPGRIPVIYSTDLHHPHIDPDDHFDLATLFALKELDVRGIVLDCGAQQQKAPGSVPVRQMLRLTDRSVPYAVGLASPLESPEDGGLGQPADYQGGVELILTALRQSSGAVTIFTTGSLRDVAAALNREPDLLLRKVARLYVNAGNPATGTLLPDDEYNVGLDRQAYLRVMSSGLPIYWCPCFDGKLWERGRNGTFWKFAQADVLEGLRRPVQNYFIYALTKPDVPDSLQYLYDSQDAAARETVWRMARNMWCTAPFFHAAGRNIYVRGTDDWIALSPDSAVRAGLSGATVDVFGFVPAKLVAARQANGAIEVTFDDKQPANGAAIFESRSDRYDVIMTACLRNLLAEIGGE